LKAIRKGSGSLDRIESSRRDHRGVYITIGYPAVVIAVYWLMNSSTTTGLEWAMGNLWTLGAMTAFVYGFNALNAVSEQQNRFGRAVESIPDATSEATRVT
jgi:hypothetical protein